MRLCMYLHLYIYIYIYICVHIDMCVCVSVAQVSKPIYIYIYIFIYRLPPLPPTLTVVPEVARWREMLELQEFLVAPFGRVTVFKVNCKDGPHEFFFFLRLVRFY